MSPATICIARSTVARFAGGVASDAGRLDAGARAMKGAPANVR
jgi:hypothetical protein